MCAIQLSDIHASQPSEDQWQQGQLVEVEITDLTDNGDGVGRFGKRVVFVPDTVPGDQALVRLVRVKPQYAHGKLHQLIESSTHRIRPSCIVADKCGGCQWQHIAYEYQLEAKRHQVIQALERLGGLHQPPVDSVIPAPSPLGYRNKSTYPLGLSTTGQVQAGYYQKGSHQLINLNQCPVQDPRLNPLLTEVKLDIQQRGWQVYDENRHKGKVRHLALRIGRHTGEMLLTLVVTDWDLSGITQQAQVWMNRYPQLVGICLNRNPERTNVIFGTETRCITGQPYLREEFAGLQFQVRPDTFFQVYTEQAEQLLQAIIEQLNPQGNEVLLDAYCGIGTLTLPLVQRVQRAIGLEVQPEAVEQATLNAQLNNLTNVSFQVGAVETLLPQLGIKPDIVLLDPPVKAVTALYSKACCNSNRAVLSTSACKPATLARDLKVLCQPGGYQLTRVQPADFFPQTSHVECAAFLVRSEVPNSKLLSAHQ